MSKRQRQDYDGCWVERHHGRLRLVYRVRSADMAPVRVTRATGLEDTPGHRRTAENLAQLVAACLRSGRSAAEIDAALAPSIPRALGTTAEVVPAGPTLRIYYAEWFAERRYQVRPGLARDYQRHFREYILPSLGNLPLTALRPKDVRGLQAELLARKLALRKGRPITDKTLSVKTVKNTINGSFRALWRQARADELVTNDIFVGLTWPKWEHPEPDPFQLEEVRRICEWFGARRFGFPPLPGSMGVRRFPHPAFHAYAHTLFFTGLRPSEASGLQWQDVDLARGLLYVRRSYHLATYQSPKTRRARRTVELLPETVRVLRALAPLHLTPETPVFTSTTRGPIEPKSFSMHWDTALRSLGIRPRGLYCTKDTYVSHALRTVRDPWWVETQTGVALETLKQHYAKWMPTRERSELHRLARAFAAPSEEMKEGELPPGVAASGGTEAEVRENSEDFECEEGDLNPHGCYPTSPSN
jgi:integrase